MQSSAADAVLYGGTENDALSGYGGTFYGGDGADQLLALRDVEAFGDLGNDELLAEKTSTVHGGEGDDLIVIADDAQGFGDAGNDTFVRTSGFGANAYEGVTTLTGGAGSDRFVFGDFRGNGMNAHVDNFTRDMVITDFDPATDQIGLMVDQAKPTDVTITTQYDGATNTTIVRVVGQGGQLADPTDSITAIFRLQGQTSFAPANLRFFTEAEIPQFRDETQIA